MTDVAEVLAAHRESWQSDGDYGEKVWLECAVDTCEWNDRIPLLDFQEEQAAFIAHVASHLQPLIDAEKQQAAARAWDDGYNDAVTMARCYGHTDHWSEEDEPPNPYREARRPAPTGSES